MLRDRVRKGRQQKKRKTRKIYSNAAEGWSWGFNDGGTMLEVTRVLEEIGVMLSPLTNIGVYMGIMVLVLGIWVRMPELGGEILGLWRDGVRGVIGGRALMGELERDAWEKGGVVLIRGGVDEGEEKGGGGYGGGGRKGGEEEIRREGEKWVEVG